jgi:hypothetical protein
MLEFSDERVHDGRVELAAALGANLSARHLWAAGAP